MEHRGGHLGTGPWGWLDAERGGESAAVWNGCLLCARRAEGINVKKAVPILREPALQGSFLLAAGISLQRADAETGEREEKDIDLVCI